MIAAGAMDVSVARVGMIVSMIVIMMRVIMIVVRVVIVLMPMRIRTTTQRGDKRAAFAP